MIAANQHDQHDPAPRAQECRQSHQRARRQRQRLMQVLEHAHDLRHDPGQESGDDGRARPATAAPDKPARQESSASAHRALRRSRRAFRAPLSSRPDCSPAPTVARKMSGKTFRKFAPSPARGSRLPSRAREARPSCRAGVRSRPVRTTRRAPRRSADPRRSASRAAASAARAARRRFRAARTRRCLAPCLRGLPRPTAD